MKTKYSKTNKPTENLPAVRKPHVFITHRQEMFIEEYAKHGRPTQAALTVGYSKKNAKAAAKRLLAKATIQERLATIQEELKQRNEVTRDYLVMKLKEVIDDTHSRPNERTNAVMGLARITGFIKEKAPETKQVVVFQTIKEQEQEIGE